MELEPIKKYEPRRENHDDDDRSSYEDTVQSQKRETWGGRFECLLSLIGYTVGFSNIWRFPYLCYRNGGGAFLIPFSLFLLLCGGPLYYMEVVAGQFSGKSVINVWDMCPLFRGVGITMCITSSIYIWCYALVFSWILYFLFCSFYPTLGWTTCDNEWNTPSCIGFGAVSHKTPSRVMRKQNFGSKQDWPCITLTTRDGLNVYARNKSHMDYNSANITSPFNSTSFLRENTSSTSPGWEFWQYNVLQKSRDIGETGSLQWHLLAGLFVGWLLVFLCLIKGIKSLGKIFCTVKAFQRNQEYIKNVILVVYVTVIGPYILLTVLLIRGLTLEGATEGVKLYLIPKFDRLAQGQIWMEAAVQVFYSLGPAWGSLITMASFNKFNNNALRDATVVCFFDIFTAFYGGLVVFSVIGFLSLRTGSPIDELPFSGPALAFIVYPEALGQLPLPQFWSVLFFLTLVFIGIDTMFGTFEVVSNAIIDINYSKLHKYRTHVSAAVVLLLFLAGIPLTFSNGLYIFQLADWYLATFNILAVAILEPIVISWVYGANRYSKDIEMMLGKPPSVFLRLQWAIIAPMFLGAILLMNLTSYSPVEGEGGYQYPSYALFVGNFIAMGPLVPIFVGAVYTLYEAPGSIPEKFRTSLSPNSKWKPNDPESAEIYRTNPYKYSRGFCDRIIIDVLGVKQTPDL